jgi:hypothetical protein
MFQDRVCMLQLNQCLQDQYTRDQTFISDQVRSTIRDVLVDDVANIVYEYIFPTQRIDYTRDPLFDVWYQGEWIEARIVRPGTYPDFEDHPAEQKEVECVSVPQFVKLENSSSQFNVRGVMNQKFIPEHVAAYQSRILHPHSHYYSMEELKKASDEHRLFVCDTGMMYYPAQIMKMVGDNLVWLHFTDFHQRWDECIPIQSYRFYIFNDTSLSCRVPLHEWRLALIFSIQCYHHFQMLTLDLLVSHNFNKKRIRAALAQHVCQMIVP